MANWLREFLDAGADHLVLRIVGDSKSRLLSYREYALTSELSSEALSEESLFKELLHKCFCLSRILGTFGLLWLLFRKPMVGLLNGLSVR